MADLDDFFAKKDRKKKTKKGFSKANADVLAKKLEENERKELKAEEKTSLATSEATKLAFEDHVSASEGGVNGEGGQGHPAGVGRNDDEWLDYENEKKDYSGLKIESLKVSENKSDEESDNELNEEGEKVSKNRQGGPWNKGKKDDETKSENGNDSDEDNEEEKTETAPPATAASAVAGGSKPSSYVPPHMRGVAAVSDSRNNMAPTRIGQSRGGRGNRQAPDITNEMYFPSLGATGQPSEKSRGGRDDFEEVRAWGGSQPQSSSRQPDAPKLSTSNKFAALRD